MTSGQTIVSILGCSHLLTTTSSVAAQATNSQYFNLSRIQTNSFGDIIDNRTGADGYDFYYRDLKVILSDDSSVDNSSVIGLYWKQSENSIVEFLAESGSQNTFIDLNNLPYEFYSHVDTLNPYLASVTSVGNGFCSTLLGNYCSVGMKLHELEYDVDSKNITKMALDTYRICSDFFGLIYCQAWIRTRNSNVPVDIESLLDTNQCPGVGGGPKSASYDCPQIGETSWKMNIGQMMENTPVWIDSGRIEPTYSLVEMSAFHPENRSNDDPVVQFRTLLPFQSGHRYILNSPDPTCGWDSGRNNPYNNEYSSVIVDINGKRCNNPNGYLDILEVEYDLVTTWPKRLAMNLEVECPHILVDQNITIRIRYQSNIDNEADNDIDAHIKTTTDDKVDNQAKDVQQEQQHMAAKSSRDSSSFAILYRRRSRDSLRRMDVRHVQGNLTTEGEEQRLEVVMDGYHVVVNANQSIFPGYQALDQSMQYPSGEYEYPCNVEGLIQQTPGLHFFGRLEYMCSCYQKRWTVLVKEIEYGDDGNLQVLAMDFHFQCSTRESKMERFGWIRINSDRPLNEIPVSGPTHFSDCVRDVHFDIVANDRYGLVIPEGVASEKSPTSSPSSSSTTTDPTHSPTLIEGAGEQPLMHLTHPPVVERVEITTNSPTPSFSSPTDTSGQSKPAFHWLLETTSVAIALFGLCLFYSV